MGFVGREMIPSSFIDNDTYYAFEWSQILNHFVEYWLKFRHFLLFSLGFHKDKVSQGNFKLVFIPVERILNVLFEYFVCILLAIQQLVSHILFSLFGRQ